MKQAGCCSLVPSQAAMQESGGRLGILKSLDEGLLLWTEWIITRRVTVQTVPTRGLRD